MDCLEAYTSSVVEPRPLNRPEEMRTSLDPKKFAEQQSSLQFQRGERTSSIVWVVVLGKYVLHQISKSSSLGKREGREEV